MEIKDNKIMMEVEVTPIVCKLQDEKAIKRINKIDHRISELNRKLQKIYRDILPIIYSTESLLEDLQKLRTEMDSLPTITIPVEVSTDSKKRFSFYDWFSKYSGRILIIFIMILISLLLYFDLFF